MGIAYLDNGATTPVSSAAAQKALSMMCDCFGNPSSVHGLGIAAEEEVNFARQTIAARLSSMPEEIFFTSGGTESNNLAVLGGALAARRRGNKVVTTAVEHPSVLEAFRELEARGFQVTYLPVNQQGVISVADMERVLDDATVLISVMLVNNETGAIQPVRQIAGLLKRKHSQALLHCDCVQAFGKMPFTASTLGAHMVSISGHKIHAPKGVGALYIKKGIRLLPQTYGGGQEKNLRSGTVATSQIAAMGVATEEMPDAAVAVQVAETLRSRLLAGIADLPDVILNSTEQGSPFIVNLSVPGVPSEVMIRALEADGVYVSGGSACAKGARSHVLMAQGCPPRVIDSALRVSLSHHTTAEEIDSFLQSLHTAYRVLHRKK